MTGTKKIEFHLKSAVTRIRTWVIAATTQCTNHYTITATQWMAPKNCYFNLQLWNAMTALRSTFSFSAVLLSLYAVAHSLYAVSMSLYGEVFAVSVVVSSLYAVLVLLYAVVSLLCAVLFNLYAVPISLYVVILSLCAVLIARYAVLNSLYAVLYSCGDFSHYTRCLFLYVRWLNHYTRCFFSLYSRSLVVVWFETRSTTQGGLGPPFWGFS